MPITIGIPFYNAEAYLADAVRSIFAQTYQDWELILVDDGSSDRSLEIARSIQDPRVRVIADGQNRKLSYRLNQITAEAKFDLVGRMDADDLISPTRFEKQLAILNEHPGIDLVTTGVCSLSNDNRPIGLRSGSPDDSITGRKLILGQCAVVHAAMFGKRSWFLRNKYDESTTRAQDYELWLRAFSKNDFKLYVMSEPLYYYREEDNVTPKRLLKAYVNQRHLYKKYGALWFNRYEIPLMITESYCKSIIVPILASCNMMDILLKRRNRSIDDINSLNHFNLEIEQILKTHVPGLSE